MNIQVHNPGHDRNLNPLEDKTVLPMVWVEMVRFASSLYNLKYEQFLYIFFFVFIYFSYILFKRKL